MTQSEIFLIFSSEKARTVFVSGLFRISDTLFLRQKGKFVYKRDSTEFEEVRMSEPAWGFAQEPAHPDSSPEFYQYTPLYR